MTEEEALKIQRLTDSLFILENNNPRVPDLNVD
jgi:hypothetical protein